MYILLIRETLITPDQSISSGADSGSGDERMMQVLLFVCLKDDSKENRSLQPLYPVLMSTVFSYVSVFFGGHCTGADQHVSRHCYDV